MMSIKKRGGQNVSHPDFAASKPPATLLHQYALNTFARRTEFRFGTIAKPQKHSRVTRNIQLRPQLIGKFGNLARLVAEIVGQTRAAHRKQHSFKLFAQGDVILLRFAISAEQAKV